LSMPHGAWRKAFKPTNRMNQRIPTLCPMRYALCLKIQNLQNSQPIARNA
jgi:hypothetical protein